MTKTMLSVVGAGLLLLTAQGAVIAAGPGTTSAIILKYNASPRAEGMGEACVAVSNDQISAAKNNPSGLFNNDMQEISAVYNRGIMDDAFGCLNYSQPLGDKFSIGGTFLYYDAGRFDLTTLAGDTIHVNAQRDFLGVLTGAYELHILGRDILIGANLKCVHSTLLESVSAFSVALDLGTMYELRELMDWLYVGLAIRNLGTPMVFVEVADPMPVKIQMGLSYQLLRSTQHSLLLAADMHMDLEDHVRGNFGVEYWFDKTVAVRTGYKVGYDLDNLTAGVGFRYMNFQLDYSFSLMKAFDSMHKFSLTYTIAQDLARKQEITRSGPPQSEATPRSTSRPVSQSISKVKPRPVSTPVPTVTARIVRIDKIGNEPKTLIINIGENRQTRIGYKGEISDTSNRVVAKIEILEVYPQRSMAYITSRSGKIDKNAKVCIFKKR
jgi:hypothetical protein